MSGRMLLLSFLHLLSWASSEASYSAQAWKHLQQPVGCQDATCHYSLQWRRSDSNALTFRLSAKVDAELAWVAFGWNKQPHMASASVVECISVENRVIVQASYNQQHTNFPLLNSRLGLIESSGIRDGDGIHCNFTHTINTPASNEAFKVAPFDQPFYLLLAHGSADAGGNKLKHVQEPYTSPNPVHFLEASASRPVLIIAHGSLMMFSWLLCIGLATLIAKHMKKKWDQSLYGTALWFQLHRGLVLSAAVFIFIALVLIFTHNQWTYYRDTHSILGLITVAFIIANISLGVVRPDHHSTYRHLFNFFHGLFGHVVFILGVVTIFFGLKNEYILLPGWLSLLALVFGCFKILIDVILNFLFTGRTTYNEINSTDRSQEDMCKTITMVTYVIGSFIIFIFLVLYLILSPVTSTF